MMRTFAMAVVGAGYAVAVAVFVYFLVALILPAAATDAQAASFVPIVGGFVVVFVVLGLATVGWAAARRRAGFWLVCALSGALVLLMFAPDIAFSISHPADAQGFIPTVLAVAAAGLLVAGGIAAFLDVRRSRPTWDRAGRAGVAVTAVAGVVAGAVATSILAGTAGSGGGGVAEAPTVTAVLTAENTKYLETALSMGGGDILGVFVVNRDAIAHSFDIDALNIHLQLPAHGTTAVAIRPAGAGSLTFYCAIPGHRQAGMVGTITVGG